MLVLIVILLVKFLLWFPLNFLPFFNRLGLFFTDESFFSFTGSSVASDWGTGEEGSEITG
ncbi:MAG: hypothetical protein AB7V25_17655 [Mangrovibacterium sp.]